MSREASNENVTAVGGPVRRRGLKPLLSMEQESFLVQWVLTQQSAGQRVSRDDVIAHAHNLRQDATSTSTPGHSSSHSIGMGWCNRFVARHPELNLRSKGLTLPLHPPVRPDAMVHCTISEANAINLEPTLNRDKISKPSDEAGRRPTRKYNRKHMEAAVAMYLAGQRMHEVMDRFPQLHQRTIRRRVLRVQRGEVDKRRGPRPLLEGAPEHALVAWILDRQRQGQKVTKKDILTRANEQYRLISGDARENQLKDGWLRRFKDRHPILTGRTPATSRKEGETSGEEGKGPGPGESMAGSQLLPVTDERREICQTSREETRWMKRLEIGGAESRSKMTATHCGTNPRRRSSLTDQDGDVKENKAKLDALMQSNQRLEAMQRQQLEMLQQLCASDKEVASSTGGKLDAGSKCPSD